MLRDALHVDHRSQWLDRRLLHFDRPVFGLKADEAGVQRLVKRHSTVNECRRNEFRGP